MLQQTLLLEEHSIHKHYLSCEENLEKLSKIWGYKEEEKNCIIRE